MLPSVTGSRLTTIKLCQVRLGKSAAVFETMSQNSGGDQCFTKIATGIKYILATQCSNPAATKAVIGKIIDENFVRGTTGTHTQPYSKTDKSITHNAKGK